MIYWFLVLPGLAAIYVMFIRKLLEGVPALKKFYAEANGFWAKVWAICGKSLTMLWGYFLTGVGMSFAALDKIGPLLGDPELNLQQKVVDALKNHPAYAGYGLMAISVITIACRLRSILKTA